MGMKAVLLGVTASLVGIGFANAADVSGPGSLKDVPYVATTWTWTGFYGGLTAGYGSGVSKNFVDYGGNTGNDNVHGWAENDPSGVLLGGAVGYNYQFTPNWVVGAEADISWSGMEGQQHKYIYDGHDWSGGWDGFATIRGRIGYAMGSTLFYGTAGLAMVYANEVIVGNDANEVKLLSRMEGWIRGWRGDRARLYATPIR